LILTKYPELESIKDLGSVFSSPWKKKFFSLLGQERSLDDIEHGMIRAPGAFDDPRIHAGVVCASIGCPMLRPEAFTPEKLDAQLDDGMKRFLADGTRNRHSTPPRAACRCRRSSTGTARISRKATRATIQPEDHLRPPRRATGGHARGASESAQRRLQARISRL
jgi:hypothetical protein